MIAVGAAILGACLVIGFIDHQLIHYWWALVLLGVGWNFMQLGAQRCQRLMSPRSTLGRRSTTLRCSPCRRLRHFWLSALKPGLALFDLFQRAATALPCSFCHPPATARNLSVGLFDGVSGSITLPHDTTSRASYCGSSELFRFIGLLRRSKLCRPCD